MRKEVTFQLEQEVLKRCGKNSIQRKCISLQWPFLTLMAGSPWFSRKKVGMFTGKFCDFPIKWCSSGFTIVDSVVRLRNLFMARIRRMRVCRRSMTVSCFTKLLRLVRGSLDFGKRCASSPCIKNKVIWCTWSHLWSNTYWLRWIRVHCSIRSYGSSVIPVRMKFVRIYVEHFVPSPRGWNRWSWGRI